MRFCKHLVFIEPARYDRITRKCRKRNAKYERGKQGMDPRQDVPKKRTLWPGQHVTAAGASSRRIGRGTAGPVLTVAARSPRVPEMSAASSTTSA